MTIEAPVEAPKTKTPRRPKQPLFDSLVMKRCSHDERDWETCLHDWRYHVTHEGRKFRGAIPGARSYDEAKRSYARIAQNIRDGKAPLDGFTLASDARTIREASETWLSLPRGRKASTIDGYQDIVNAHILPALGPRTIAEITPSDCERFILRVKPARRTLPLSARTKQAIAVTLQALFSFCQAQRWRLDNPAERLGDTLRDADTTPEDAVLDPHDHSKYFTEEEARLLLRTVEQQFPEWALFIRTALQTGMRMGELAALRYQQINWRQRYIRVNANFVKGRFTSPKNGKSREVVIHKRLNVLLRLRWRQHRDGSRLVFPSEAGTPLDINNFRRRAWQQIMDATDLDHRSPKAMRHCHTTLLLMSGEPIAWVAAQAGRSIAETEKTYYHFLPTKARGGADALARLLESKDPTAGLSGVQSQQNETFRSDSSRHDPRKLA